MGPCLRIQRQRRPIFGRRCAFQGLILRVWGFSNSSPRERFSGSVPGTVRLVASVLRCAVVRVCLRVWRWGFRPGGAPAGLGLRSLGRLKARIGFRAARWREKGCSPPMLAPVRPRGRPVAGVARRLRSLWIRALVDCTGLDAGCQRQRCASNSTSPARTSSRSRPARLRANWAVRKPCLAPMS